MCPSRVLVWLLVLVGVGTCYVDVAAGQTVGIEAGAGQQSEGEASVAVQELRLADLEDSIRALSRRVDELTDELQKKDSEKEWHLFGRDIKEAVKDSVKYEYATMRNGGFRRLTASNWNRGQRVMTSAYMTSDVTPFRMGGSMWIWGTNDPRDDDGVYHLYYYFQGDGVVAHDGNGRCDDACVPQLYRRRR